MTDNSTGGETARECSEAAKAEAGGRGGGRIWTETGVG